MKIGKNKPKKAQRKKEQNSSTSTNSSTGFKEFPVFVKNCKNTKSAGKKNMLIIYYHEMVAQSGPVNEDEIKKKYKEMGWKPNKHFQQSLIDTKNKNGWIYKVGEDNNEHDHAGWLTTHQGSAFVKEKMLNN